MSAIATFTLFPKAKLNGLRDAAVPKQRLFGAPKDSYHEYLQQESLSEFDYDWSGYLLATLFVYLKERHNIDLMRSEYDELARLLSKQRGGTHFVFTDQHKQTYLDRLSAESYSATELCEYYNTFNAAAETEIGEPLLDGIRAIQKSLEQLDSDTVSVLKIG